MYTILFVIVFYSSNGVAISTEQIGKFDDVKTCEAVAAYVHADYKLFGGYRPTETRAKCVQIKDKTK